MRDAENIREVSALRPDYMGFIFYPQSKRYVAAIDEELLAGIAPEIKKTGVFVNEPVHGIMENVLAFNLQAVQLHGNEQPDLCGKIKMNEVEVIKAFGIDDNFDFNILEAYKEVVDYFLFDTKTSGYGGSGKAFDWGVLDQYNLDIPYFLSGGLNPENISRLLGIDDQRLYGADLNSGFETSPAMKNITELKKAFNLIRL